MEIDGKIAAALGWPKPKYAGIERERRWLCKDIPLDLVRSTEGLPKEN